MAKKIPELSENQKLLMTASAEESVRDWGSSLGDERLRMLRVLVKKVIRAGDADSMAAVAEYYGVFLTEEN